MSEEWKLIRQADDIYEISNRGRVRRADTGKIVPANMGGRGYLFVRLPRSKNGRSYVVHRLVCQAFVGSAPSEKHEVNHIDGNKLNNCADNLEWVTRSQNTLHANAMKLRDIRGERHPRTKLTNDDIRTIRYLYSTGNYTIKQLAGMYRLTENGMGHITAHRTWKHLP